MALIPYRICFKLGVSLLTNNSSLERRGQFTSTQRGCIQSVRLTTVARSAMFEGKFRATAVLNILSNKWTCLPSQLLILSVIFGPKISQTCLVCKKSTENSCIMVLFAPLSYFFLRYCVDHNHAGDDLYCVLWLKCETWCDCIASRGTYSYYLLGMLHNVFGNSWKQSVMAYLIFTD